MTGVDWQFIAILIPTVMGWIAAYMFGEMMGAAKMSAVCERKMMRKVLDDEE